jgi:hypothetical protein
MEENYPSASNYRIFEGKIQARTDEYARKQGAVP